VPALRVEVLFPGDVGYDAGEHAFPVVRGEGRRVSGPAADDPDGALEFDPVGVDACFGGGLADQGTDRVVGEQVAVDLLADHIRAPGPQHPPGAAQVRLELGVPGLDLGASSSQAAAQPSTAAANAELECRRILAPGKKS
jgi:hypothetical protein